ncbi:hypothetical protein [Nocardioides sp. SR21]|uniref:hypothetical protein n=1 Tax=Nocardioides sp. SR21 TaxID=2919501 RepID=UPI001FAB2A9B|nr:hypothetical protein [Nocardioides sp. SR21]
MLSTLRLTSSTAGAMHVRLSRAAPGVSYRFVVTFTGDAYGKPSSATSATVVISR